VSKLLNMAGMSIKIKEVLPPSGELREFDPGAYIGEMEFYEIDAPITEEDRQGSAELLHIAAYIALKNSSAKWASSAIMSSTSAHSAVVSHFSHLPGFGQLLSPDGIHYKSLVSFLMALYPPRVR
jgi:hypothetical protein